MDSRPPTGDDLTRMIVSMKQNVIRRTETPPRRSRAHVGLIIGAVVLLGIGTASGAVALGLVGHPFAAPVPPSPSSTVSTAVPAPSTSASAAPAPAPSAAPVAGLRIPTECTDVVAAVDAGRLFGASPLQQALPAVAGSTPIPVPSPPGPDPSIYKTPSLYCIWADPRADVTHLTVEMGTASTAETSASIDALVERGFTCSTGDGGRFCQQVKPDDEYPVDQTRTFFVRGDTWIEISQANFPTSDLLGAITDHLSQP
ncbi:hypothetical protein AS850_06870 [Frondihabitans sp. 762G35]|uniref:hypothetical protein n=1 Tax=Frondihabitans sp. 762G35 TaxID=1446794 RepID=UPI000D21401D|nr:hypothetical protein [Frondihabitans sp. 762G35]ARC56797.1 hypothetical protein AS850_06870 [Frondihabitans sp. 762G35]